MRHSLRRLFLATVLGAATTVGSAWVIGNVGRYWPRRPFLAATRDDGERQITIRPFSHGRYFFALRTDPFDYVGAYETAVAQLEEAKARGSTVILPPARWEQRSWGQMPLLTHSITPLSTEICGVAQGWPWPALYALSDSLSVTDGEAYEGMFRIDRPIFDFFLPYYVHWPTFAASTILYAAPWFLLMSAPRALRRRRRRRRGLCTSCGYDLGGAIAGPCPECGAAR